MYSSSEQLGRISKAARLALLVWLAIALLLAVTMWIAPAFADSAAVEITLRDDVRLGGNTYILSDVCEYTTGDSALWNSIASEPLGCTPAPGDMQILTADTILGRLAERGYDWQRIAISGSTQITIFGATAVLDAGELIALLEEETSAELGTSVSFEATQAITMPQLSQGEVTTTVRFPDKPGQWLPDAIEFQLDGRLAAVVLLRQHGMFRLNVVIAPTGIPTRTLIDASHLSTEEQLLTPGTEVATTISDVTNMTTRSSVAQGAMVKLSKLQQPYDVLRSGEVLLIINLDGVELSARAVVMSDAYIGQRVQVKRLDDGARFTGLVIAGQMVVVK